MRIYKNHSCKNHDNYNLFIKRFQKASSNNSFLSEKPESYTPLSVIQSSKYILDIDNKPVFILTPHFFFEETLDCLFRISKKTNSQKSSPEQLLSDLYNDNTYRELKPSWNHYSWSKSLTTFKTHLINESFFYIDDLNNQYYFNLFRLIQDEEFVGGLLHPLTKHYDTFTRFHPNPMGIASFQYNNFFHMLVQCVISGETIGDKTYKSNGNFTINKEHTYEGKTLRVILFWDKRKDLFFLNSIYFIH